MTSELKDTETDRRKAAAELRRRANFRQRKAEGLPTHQLNGSQGKYNIPTRKTVEAGVEARRAKKVKVTLPSLVYPKGVA